MIYHQIRIPAVKSQKQLILSHFPEQSISQKIGKWIGRTSWVSSQNIQTTHDAFILKWLFSVSVCEYRFRDTLEFDCLLSDADNVICCPHQERK